MKNTILLATLGITLTHSLFAGRLTLSGSKKLGHKPEFVAVDVHVQSQCFLTQESLLQATNGAAQKIKDVMRAYMSTSEGTKDKLIARPGFTRRETITYYNQNTQKQEILCQNGWHMENTIQLQIADGVTSWPALQREVLSVMDEYQDINKDHAALQITLFAPTPSLYPDTLALLKIKAEQQALKEVSDRFYGFANQCGFKKVKMKHVSFSEMFTNYGNPRYDHRMEKSMTSSSATPIDFNPEFDLIYVGANVSMDWSFKHGDAPCDI